MTLTNAQKKHLRYLCADAMNRIDWAAELAETGIPQTDELWEYLRSAETRIAKALGYPEPTLWN